MMAHIDCFFSCTSPVTLEIKFAYLRNDQQNFNVNFLNNVEEILSRPKNDILNIYITSHQGSFNP